MRPRRGLSSSIYNSTPTSGILRSGNNSRNFQANLNYGGAATSIALFRTIIQSAYSSPTRAIRMLQDGDSQETAPTGHGDEYNLRLNYEFWKRFGNIPESQIMDNAAYGGGVPPAAICQAGQLADGVAAGDVSITRYPYGMDPQAFNRFTYNSSEGIGTVLQANLLSAQTSLTEIDRTVEYLSRTGLVFHMLVPHVTTQGKTLRIRSTASTNGAVQFFNADQAVNTADITAYSDNNVSFTEITQVYNYGGSPPTAANLLTNYPQVVVTGHSDFPTTPVETGPTWFSSGNTKGIIVSMNSQGGVVTTDQFTDRANMLQFINGYAPSIIILSCGANDAGAGVTPAQFKTNVQTKINTYQAGLAGSLPNLMFILMSDPDLTTIVDPVKLADLDGYGAVLRQIALDPTYKSVFIDRNRILKNKYNWDRNFPSTIANYLLDGVHYSTAGARLVAIEDAAAILDMGA